MSCNRARPCLSWGKDQKPSIISYTRVQTREPPLVAISSTWENHRAHARKVFPQVVYIIRAELHHIDGAPCTLYIHEKHAPPARIDDGSHDLSFLSYPL